MEEQIAKMALYLGAALSVGIASVSNGFGSGQIAAYATKGMGRQPQVSDTLLKTMLISQAVTESGAIFALVISMLLLFGGALSQEPTIAEGLSLLAAGLAMGLGATGPKFGSSYAGSETCEGIARTPHQSMTLTTNMLIGQALAQTSAIFALVVSLLLIYVARPTSTELLPQIMNGLAYIGAAFAIGLGTLGPGTGIGYVAGKAAKMISRHKEQQSFFMRTMFLGAAVTESTAIYALVVAFLLIFM